MDIYLDPNKIYKAVHVVEGKNYICFIKQEKNLFIDVLTNKKIANIIAIDYNDNKSLLKYFKKVSNIENILEITDAVNTGYINYFLYTLRFFELDYNDLFNNSSDRNLLNRVIKKWLKYIKRHVDSSNLSAYEEQLKKFNNLSDILCFSSNEINQKIIPFWISEIHNYQYYIWAIFGEDVIKAANNFDFNLMDMIRDRSKSNIIVNQNLSKSLNDLINQYKNKSKELIREKIQQSKTTLNFELEEANKINDEDLIMEIGIISDEISNIEKTIFDAIDSLPQEIEILDKTIDWWPEILYPVIEVEVSKKDYNYAQHLKYFFHD